MLVYNILVMNTDLKGPLKFFAQGLFTLKQPNGANIFLPKDRMKREEGILPQPGVPYDLITPHTYPHVPTVVWGKHHVAVLFFWWSFLVPH